ncbi:T9SS type A sorting domain-containing protein [Aequorivita antarctica]|uniref:T9SS type A sorting domain-containing protein n=1 Tax=Aequorivita antarctica TaxID=153266 RepID=A0A5C6Z453_9FLAO|nr:T9SS type A sorting domain-containing protein [Aequorivita antarctica]TXD74392.1 T9SS type A sorting domain-containing protein [Aequorivita antarctica]
MMQRIILLVAATLISFCSFSQTAPFELSIEPININGLGGIQSYAVGQDNGKWLIVGGRLDGLHRRQPWAAFDIAGNNNQLIVIDPLTEQKWSAPLTSLPTGIQEQLSSTNMEFFQEGDYLYCIGGYGYSATAGDHTTYANLTAIKVSDVINAIVTNSSFSSYFRQIADPQFQVTGGGLNKIYDVYHLLGGQKFIGRYNPNNGPTFVQEYSNQIRRFTIADNGTSITINHLPSYTDTENLHRRDYNAESQILPDGTEGITMFSGVFQQTIDLPFLNSVTVASDGYAVNNAFQQYYNHYHCPVLPIYSITENEMHSVFFGGIAQFYDNNGTLVQDDNVPFVNTIARVTRDANGVMSEHKLPIEMPALLGSGAEFIPNLNFPHFENMVFKLDNITNENTLIGYIFGGISSSQPNIFFINDGTQSTANNQIFKVFIKAASPLSIDDFNAASTDVLNLKIYPNPNDGILNLQFNLIEKDDVKISVFDVKGVLVDKVVLKNLKAGKNNYSKEIKNLTKGGVYLITLETSTGKVTHKLIIEN